MISVSDVFFPRLSNDAGSFYEIIYFHLQIVQNLLYLKKCIFNIFFLPSRSKAEHFLRRKEYFPKIRFLREIEFERVFEDQNGKFRINCLHQWKAEEKIRRKRLSFNVFKYILVS